MVRATHVNRSVGKCQLAGMPSEPHPNGRYAAGRVVRLISRPAVGWQAVPAVPVMKPSWPAAGPGVGHRRVDRDLAGVGAEVQRRLVTLSVVQGEVRDRAVGGQVVAVAGMPVAVGEREVGACDLDADPVAP